MFLVAAGILGGAGSGVHACPGQRGECGGSAEGRLVFREDNQTAEIRVFLDEQTLTLFLAGRAVFCTPVSTGRRPGWTPLGTYSIISKHAKHRSSAYGKLISRSGKTLRRDVDSRKIEVPKGARFAGSPMPNFLRMTSNGIGVHAGVLPGRPASKGCIRVSQEASEALFRNCQVGDMVSVVQRREEIRGGGVD